MASYTPTVSLDDPTTSTGGNGHNPPHHHDGDDFGPSFFDVRLRRARLGLVVGLTGIVMIFISFSSAYVVRQGLPTLDPRTDVLLHDWFPVPLPRLLLINTAVLLISSLTMEIARRQAARKAALARLASVPGVSMHAKEEVSWLALTVVLGLSFLAGQWMAWRELAASGFYVASSPSSSFVYLLTGMHGVHLFGGVVALLTAGAASLLRRPADSQAIAVDVTGWYWHFMAFLWVYILCLLEFVH
ncbi:MAG: cytochrome c oxidase subunit [Acidobacteriaceae bacterium]